MTKTISVEAALKRAETARLRAEAKAEFYQAETNKLAVQLAEIRQLNENLEREIVDVRAYNRSELKRAEELVDVAGKNVERVKSDNNALRGIVLDLQLTVARQNGYLDGIEDGKPPRMIEERRELRRMEPGPTDIFANSPRDRYSTGPTKKWFEQ